jgi:hypothetical protein
VCILSLLESMERGEVKKDHRLLRQVADLHLCVRVCACVLACMYIPIYIHVCMRVCVCVCVLQAPLDLTSITDSTTTLFCYHHFADCMTRIMHAIPLDYARLSLARSLSLSHTHPPSLSRSLARSLSRSLETK